MEMWWAPTPLRLSQRLSDRLGCRVYLKLETSGPTGSHKDRESFYVIQEVLRGNWKAVGCASTGNAALSLAAFAYMAEIPCHVWVSQSVDPERLGLLRLLSAQIHQVSAGYREAMEESNRYLEREGCYNANPGRCPAKYEGNAAIGREIAEEIRPTYVVCSTNNGTLLYGVWKGVGGAEHGVKAVAAVTPRTHVACSTAGFHRFDGELLEQCLRQSCGHCVEVPDEELGQALTDFLLREGIVAECASAATVAALAHLPLRRDDVVCCVISGSGFKSINRLQQAVARRL